MQKLLYFRKHFGLIIFLGLITIITGELISHLGTDIVWFIEVGYLQVFWQKLVTQLGIAIVILGVSLTFFWGNFILAGRFSVAEQYRLKYPPNDLKNLPNNLEITSSIKPKITPKINPKISSQIKLRSLLPLIITLCLAISFLLWYYGRVLVSLYLADFNFIDHPPLPKIGLSEFPALGTGFFNSLLKGLLFLIIPFLCLVKTKFTLRAIALLLSITFTTILTANWARFLQFINPTTFNQVEPLWQIDISFYVFRLPELELGNFWLLGLFTYSLIAILLTYLLADNSLSNGKFAGFSAPQLRHLAGLGSCLSGGLIFNFWLSCYHILYSTRGANYGANYTDAHIVLPITISLSIFSTILTLALGYYALNYPAVSKLNRFLIYGAIFCMVVGAIANFTLSPLVQKLVVEPNELTRETPYIQNTINLTRLAYDLHNIESKPFIPTNNLTWAKLQKNNLTIENIRLWDKRPLLVALRQLQQIRLYYKLANADIDRYFLPNVLPTINTPNSNSSDPNKAINNLSTNLPNNLLPNSTITNNSQQIMITARELDQTSLPAQAQTWVNQHLIYTHGYGFTINPVNRFDAGGLPDYLVKDIGTGDGEKGDLWTASEAIRQKIPINKPRIYYGELTNNYVMTGTKFPELDYPLGDQNVYNNYSGIGGSSLASFWHQILFAWRLRDWQILFTDTFTPKTKLLWRRNISQRVREIAPFLKYDNDPYLVVADISSDSVEVNQKIDQKSPQESNNLFWIIDAYTISDRYPYADPGENSFNYIRNSVKVVVDAYNGTIKFYIAYPEDPIIQTWQRIFPELFQPLAAMPPSLRSHLRYPVDLFSIQSQQLLDYHMTDAKVFYNREDQWQIPREIYGDKPQQVEPYYLIMKLPEANTEEFTLLLPFTPTQRNNMISWLAARSDGDNYGKLLLYRFPKQQLTFGPEQIDTRINTDPIISQQISLWNRQGAKAIQGNLLVIPIENSLLYVEPIYLEAEQNNLPSLVRVVVAYDNQLVMAETLKQGLEKIFLSKP